MVVARNTPFRTRIYEESPWFAPIEPLLVALEPLGRFPTSEELSELYRTRVEARGLPPLRFVDQPRGKPRRKGPLDLTALYEGRVTIRREVPTRRDDWHDLFNAIAFLTFPRSKRALHARHFAILQGRLAPGATKLPNARTREQDALTLFDEGGLVVASPAPVGMTEPELAAAMRAGQARILPFGHALYEHMVAGAPCPLATAYAVTVPAEALHDLDALDAALADTLAAPTAFLEPSPDKGTSLPALTTIGPLPSP